LVSRSVATIGASMLSASVGLEAAAYDEPRSCRSYLPLVWLDRHILCVAYWVGDS
jgi:hypothetical protein